MKPQEADAERMDTVAQKQLSTGNCFDSSRAASLRNGSFIADDFVRLKLGSDTHCLLAIPAVKLVPY
jgi:hypothetical protein